MQKDGLNALKRMALMAKNRLRSKVQENDNKGAKSRCSFKVIYGASVDVKSKIITKEDARLYSKVAEMLQQEGDIFNPISRLIDYKVYNKLDDSSRERYLFELVDKYKRYKEKYLEDKKNVV